MTTEEPSTRPSGPIFIVGAMGSGTTLLRLILDSHEHIAIPQETGIMRTVNAQRWTPFWVFGGRWYTRLGMTEEDLLDELRRFYGRIFDRYARSQGKRRWGEKTPWHVWHIDGILSLWPDAAVIGMTRHPGGNVSSLMTRFGYKLSQGIRHWTRYTHELVRKGSELGDNFVLCRYEDLVLHPDETVRELLDWLGEPWSDAVRRHHDVQAARGNPTVVEGRTRADDPIDASRVAKWVDRIDERGRRKLEERTAALSSFLGYSIAAPTEITPIVEEGGRFTRMLTGPELAKRRVTMRDVIDFDDRQPVPLADRRLRPSEIAPHPGPYRTPGAMARARAGGPHISAASRAPARSRKPRVSRHRRMARRALPAAVRAPLIAILRGLRRLGRRMAGR